MADPKDRTKRTLDPKACDFRIVEDKLIKYKGSGGDVIIPEGVTSIGYRAFSDCRSLTSVINSGRSDEHRG